MICDSCKQAMTPQYRAGDWKHIAWVCYQCMRRERTHTETKEPTGQPTGGDKWASAT